MTLRRAARPAPSNSVSWNKNDNNSSMLDQIRSLWSYVVRFSKFLIWILSCPGSLYFGPTSATNAAALTLQQDVKAAVVLDDHQNITQI